MIEFILGMIIGSGIGAGIVMIHDTYMAHNHPSGDTTPSSEDMSITKKVGLAAASIDTTFHDHIIIGDGYHSMADSGWLKNVSNEFKDTLNQENNCQESMVRPSDKTTWLSWITSCQLLIGTCGGLPKNFIGGSICSKQYFSKVKKSHFQPFHLKRPGLILWVITESEETILQ